MIAVVFAVAVAAAQPVLLASAGQTAKTTGAASVACDELNAKGRALSDAGKLEDARALLTAGVQACAGATSPAEKAHLASALLTLGVIEATAQPRQALQHFRTAMDLDPDNMRAPQNVGGMLINQGAYADALVVLEKALKHGSDDPQTVFRLESNAGLALLKMCAARQAGCDGGKAKAHFSHAAELNPSFPDTFFNLAAITNDIDHDSRGAMELFRKACELGHQQACMQYDHFRSQFAAIDRQTAPTVDVLADRIRQTYPCAAVTKSSQRGGDDGIVTWTIECSGSHLYTVIVGRTGETTVIQRK